MLYIGNFSYNDDTDDKDNYCLMPCVVEARDADEALDKFAARFHELRRTSDLLEGAHEIFLDSLVELEGAPGEPVVTQWQKIAPAVDGLCSITSALPSPEGTADGNAYGWGSDDDEGDETDEELDDLEEELDDELAGDCADEEPFLVF